MSLKQKEMKNVIFICFGLDLDKMSLSINGEEFSYGSYGDCKLIILNKHEVGDTITIELKTNEESVNIAIGYLYYENEEVFKKYYERLSKEQVDLKQVSGREFEGKINMESENPYVLFTIPYDEGWKINVDGKPAEVCKVQNSLIAVKIEKGEHVINMKFVPKGIIFGAFTSGIGVIIFMILIYNLKYRKKEVLG